MKAVFIDHIYFVAEEIELHTGFRTAVLGNVISVDSFIGEHEYKCTEKTVMGDVYRYMCYFGLKLEKYGRVNRIKESKL